MKKIQDLKKEFEEENKKLDKLEDDVKEELRDYAKDALSKDIKLYDNIPFVQKFVFILVGIINFLFGYALYFIVKDDKKKKWQASYLIKGATIGLAISLIVAITEIISLFVENLIKYI